MPLRGFFYKNKTLDRLYMNFLRPIGFLALIYPRDCWEIALFGPTNPHEKIPRRAGVQYLWHAAALTCCPCYDGKTYQRCSDNICLKSISPECVYRRVKMNEGVRHNDWADR